MTDPATGQEVDRTYYVNVPDGVQEGAAVIFWFHGFCDDLSKQPFVDVGEENGVITVYPQGMSDYSEAGYYSWNCGDNNKVNSCTTLAEPYCFDSCDAIGMCGSCNWYTCIDDVAFVKAMIAELKDYFKIDETKIYVSGESNGGMFVYYLS